MYNAHRGMGPAPPGPGNPRLNDLLEQIRHEFDNQARASGEFENNSASTSMPHFIVVMPYTLPGAHCTNYFIVAAQMQEMQLVREKVFQMEQQHMAIKAKYA